MVESRLKMGPAVLSNELPNSLQLRGTLLRHLCPLLQYTPVILPFECLEVSYGSGGQQDLQNAEHLHHRITLFAEFLLSGL
jgi:hypothetical protein